MSKSTVKEFKSKGNRAYRAGQWKEAIEHYSKAIELEPANYGLYAIRSAAYLKTLQYEKVIADADVCIKLKPDYEKGYGRKAAAYHAMSEFDKSIEVYVQGLTACSETASLVKGLNSVKRSKMSKGTASKHAMTARMTRKAAGKRGREAKLAKDIGSFIETKRMELDLLILSLKNQLVLLEDLEKMSDADKMETLFYLVDFDGNGVVDAVELAAAMRHLCSDLSVGKRADKVVKRVSKLGDTVKMNSAEFASFINIVTKEMNSDISDISKFLVLQILFEDPRGPQPTIFEEEEEGEEAEKEDQRNGKNDRKDDESEEATSGMKQPEPALSRIMADPRTATIFDMFDRDGDGLLSFPEVAIGFYHVSDKNMKKSAKTAQKLLLALDKDDRRTLNLEQFGRLLMATTAASGLGYDEMADKLLIQLGKNEELSPDDFSALLSFSNKLNKSKGKTSDGSKICDLTQDRLKVLFQMWDKDSDGFVLESELLRCLGDFKRALGESSVDEETRAILGFELVGDKKLDLDAFSKALALFSKSSKANLRELIDFMCVTSVLGTAERAHSFQQAYGHTFASGLDYSENAPTPSAYYDETETGGDFLDDSSSSPYLDYL